MSGEDRPSNPSHVSPIADLIEALHLAPRQAHKALTLWPLLQRRRATERPAPRHIALRDALEAGSAVLRAPAAGHAGTGMRLENHGEHALLALLGSGGAGGPKRRGAPSSVLVAPGGFVVLDGVCVDGEHQARCGPLRQSGSGSDAILESFHTVEDQIGFVVAAGDAVVGIEVLTSSALLRALFPELLLGYGLAALRAAEAMERARPAARRLRFAAPEPFLRALTRAHWRRERAPGMGHALHLEGAGVRGCALAADGIVHLSAFADLDD